MAKLSGKIALITGGTSGIGLAAAGLFRDEGATVIVTGARREGVERAAALGFEALVSDAGSVAEIAALCARIEQDHGRIDILFANAGIPGEGSPIASLSEATFDRIVDINLKGVFFIVRHALPLMPDGGAIVLTSSVGAHSGLADNASYAASKAGVRALGRCLAAELMPRGIRVNTLTPGLTDTAIFERFNVPAETIKGHLLPQVPMGRAGTALEVAQAALFLASSDSSFMTGTETIVAGGQLDL